MIEDQDPTSAKEVALPNKLEYAVVLQVAHSKSVTLKEGSVTLGPTQLASILGGSGQTSEGMGPRVELSTKGATETNQPEEK